LREVHFLLTKSRAESSGKAFVCSCWNFIEAAFGVNEFGKGIPVAYFANMGY
jgi:hypothetical protein